MEKIKQSLKESVQLILSVIKSPITQIKAEHNLSWQNILITYVLLIFLSALVSNIFKGTILLSIPYAVLELIKSTVMHSIIIGVLFFILSKMNQGKEFIKLAEVWVLALIPSMVVSVILSFSVWLGVIPILVFVIFLRYILNNISQ